MGTMPSLAGQRRRFAVAVPVALALIATFTVLLGPNFPLDLRQSASGLGLLVAGVLAAISCGVRATQTIGRRRRSWRLLMSAAVVAVAGNVWVAIVGADPVASPSAVGNGSIAVALLLSIAGLLSFPSIRRRGIEQLLMSLDGLVAGSAVLVIASVLVYAELLDSVTADVASRSSALLFPVLDVVLATVALLLLLRTSGSDRPALALVTAGFLTYAVADLSFAVLAAQDRFHFGTYLDLGWIAGYLLIALAAWYPSARADGAPEQMEGGSTDARGTVVVFAVLLTAGIVQVGFGTGGHLPAAQAGLWLVLLLAAGTRQMLLAADNAALRRGLEQRVREQTADLSRLARQTEVLLTSVGDGIYGVDHDGRVTFVNPSGAAALGYDAGELHDRPAHDTFHAPAEDGVPFPWSGCYINDAIRHGVVASAEEDMYVRSDGTAFPVEITASPLVDDDVVRGAVVVFRDVTQRREVDRMKSEFLSVVSHELRTPLTSIRGSLGLLAGGKLGELPPRADSLVGIALQSSERLTRLINDLLDIERIQSGTKPMEIEALDACHLLAAAAHAIEGLASATKVRVELGDCSGRVLADEDRIMQTLTNLLGNAIKYSEPGDVVLMDATERDDTCCSGCGTTAAASRPTSSSPSSSASSRWTPPTPARRAGPASAWPSAAASWSGTAAGSGRRASSGPGPPSCSRCPRRRHRAPWRPATVRAPCRDRSCSSAGTGTWRVRSRSCSPTRDSTSCTPRPPRRPSPAAGSCAHARSSSTSRGSTTGPGSWADLRREHALADATLLVYSADDVAPERRADLALGRTVFLTRARVGPEELRERLVGLLDGTTGRHEGFARG
nr:histidine kinase dimerization/phospho-acceptor domain-containing protein [Nocardioides ungokensis]